MYSTSKSNRIRSVLIIIIVILVFAGALFLIVSGYRQLNRSWYEAGRESISALWEEKNYQAIIELGEQELERSPFDVNALIFCGFSYYHLALGEENRTDYLQQSITYLRRSLLSDAHPLRGETCYILGKAYFLLGRFYLNLAIEYLQLSIENGYVNSDSYEYLAVAFSRYDNVEESIEFYRQQSLENDTPELLLAFARELMRGGSGYFTETAAVLNKVINTTKNSMEMEQALFSLAEIHYNDGKDARGYLEQLFEINPEHLEGLYLWGEILYNEGNPVQARAVWRRILEIDPQYPSAVDRLNR